MSENQKTLGFVAVAALVALIAWKSRPSLELKTTDERRQGQLLVSDFDPLTASSLQIVEFDEDTATVRPFEVAKVNVKGKPLWSIPSHEDYPTDAKDQLADVAAGLIGLKILDMVSDSPGDHALYGVLDPSAKTLKVGDTGVGTRVVMKDDAGKELVALIIGKAVPDRAGLRYVRSIGDDHVYVVAAKTDKLSTKFENWIEKDLLQLKAWDLKQLWIRDYSVDEVNSAIVQRGEMTLAYNDTGDPKWKMLKDEKFARDSWVPIPMAADEELNTSRLDEAKNALGDLKIVDVTRKPKGLSSDLKAAADFLNNREAAQSLAERGYYRAKLGDQVELFSNEGEVRCLMKDGVEYVLRFGGIAMENAGEPSKKDAKETTGDATKKDEKKSAGLNRYLFVMAQFNPEAIAKPQMEPLPEQKESAAAKGEKSAESKTPQETPAGNKAEKDAKDETSKKAAPPADEKDKDAAKPANKPAEEPAAKSDAATAKESATKKDSAADKEQAAKAERERIEKENKRKQDEYEAQITKGRDHVKELNARFADWYYIISDDVYHKIRLSRAEVIKKKEKEKAKTAAGQEQPAGDQGKTGSAPAAAPASPADELDKLKSEGPAGQE